MEEDEELARELLVLQVRANDRYQLLDQALVRRFEGLGELLLEVLCDCLDREQDLPLTLYMVGLLERLAEPLEGPVEQLDSEVFRHRVHARQNTNDRVQVLHVSELEHIRADLAALAVLDHLG